MSNPFLRLMFQDHFLMGFVERVEEEKHVLCFVARRPDVADEKTVRGWAEAPQTGN